MSKIHEIIKSECTEIEQEAAVDAYAHFLAGRYWDKAHMFLGLTSTCVAAAASVTAFTNNPKTAAAIALLAAISSGINAFLSPGDRASSHNRATVIFTEIRRNANLLRDVDAPLSQDDDPKTVEKLADRLRDLASKMTEADQNAPGITASAKKKAEEKFVVKEQEKNSAS